MDKQKSNAKTLIFHERIFITILVMSVLGVFLLLVGIFVPFFINNSLASSTYSNMNTIINRGINAVYGYGDVSTVFQNRGDAMYLVFVDNDGITYLPEEVKSNDDRQTIYLECYNNNKDIKDRKDFQNNGYFFSIMGSDYINKYIYSEKEGDEIVSKPISIPDETIVFALVDKESEVKSNSSFAMVLAIVLSVGFVMMIPVVYIISNRVMKPTRETIKREKEFVANASHELKTPLAIITAEAELLKDKNPDNNDYVSNIISQCQNMNETVLDMISLSKLETAPKILEEVNLSKLILNLCLSFDAVAFEREINYSYDIDNGIILEKADKKNITRLVNLLIDNAMKYTEEPKIIKVSLKLVKKEIVFEVYNTGCQVLDEDREKVFERFYQGKSGADNERVGSGLGLAIVKQICDNYHYKVSIRSRYHQDMMFKIIFKK